jgi:hypothetical protein
MARPADVDEELFWDLGDALIAAERATEGDIMQSRCLRVDGEFLAMAEYQTGDLVIKLPKQRVADLIADGEGLPFAPAKKTFSEWVQVPARDEALWTTLIDEGIEFVTGVADAKAAKAAKKDAN